MGISLWQLLIVLVIVVLLFGTKRLKNIGSDLGGAIKGFKKAVSENETSENGNATPQVNRVIENQTDASTQTTPGANGGVNDKAKSDLKS